MGLTDAVGDCAQARGCTSTPTLHVPVSPPSPHWPVGTKRALPCNKLTAFQGALCGRLEGVRRSQWPSGTFMWGASICVNLATRHLISAAWHMAAKDARRISPHPPRVMAFYTTRSAPRGGGGMQCGFCPFRRRHGGVVGVLWAAARRRSTCAFEGAGSRSATDSVPSDGGSYTIRTARPAFALCRVCAESLLEGVTRCHVCGGWHKLA